MYKLFVVLIFSTIVLFAQSDCGNCYVVGGGCDPTGDILCSPGCEACIEYVDCDNHDCAYTSPWFCKCPPGTFTAECTNKVVQHTILKQKLINRIAMRAIERKENAKRQNLLLAVRTSFLR